MSVGIMGAGAFGTALAIALGQNQSIILWARDAAQAGALQGARQNTRHLPGALLPDRISVTARVSDLDAADVLLLCVPMQKLRGCLEAHRDILDGRVLVACCKGMEFGSGLGPQEIIAEICPRSRCALLTGPSFAQDIAKGLPTALTLACAAPGPGAELQTRLSNRTLRLYRTTDVAGAALGGALKNVIAIGCGAVMGAGLGESARAALMTRGNAEMQRMAAHRGADPATLSGLSGFGDLVLTCTSELSRNYRFGLSIGRGEGFDPAITVEGEATARAVSAYAQSEGLDMPICDVVAALVEKRLDIPAAMAALLSRSLKEE